MVNENDEALIERLARAKCLADGEYDPDDDVSAIFEHPTKAWEMFCHDAKVFLAMQRAYEAWIGEEAERVLNGIQGDPTKAVFEGETGNPVSEQNQCFHEWEIDVDGLTSTDAIVANTFRCKKCGTRQRHI